jgi:hypothetical protein
MFGSEVKRKRLATEDGKRFDSEGFKGEGEGFGAEEAPSKPARIEGEGKSGGRGGGGAESFRTVD